MFNSFLDALGYMPIERAYMQAVQTMLKPLKERWPEAVTNATNAANNGFRLEAAGQALADALLAWENQVEKNAAEKVQAHSHKVFELEQQLSKLEYLDEKKDEQIRELQELLDNRENTLREMAGKLKLQNVVIAEQHQKLSSIFGDADNSHDAQKLLS